MALINARVAIYWKDKKGVQHSKIYPNLADAEYARKYLIKNGADPAQIELAIVKEAKNEPEPIAQ